MSDLAEFLLAMFAVDEAVARAAIQSPPADAVRVVWYRHDTGWVPSANGEWAEGQALFDRFDPARVLAECDAKRRIVESEIRREVGPVSHYVSSEVHAQIAARTATPVMRFLALPYADHPDYREEWKP